MKGPSDHHEMVIDRMMETPNWSVLRCELGCGYSVETNLKTGKKFRYLNSAPCGPLTHAEAMGQ